MTGVLQRDFEDGQSAAILVRLSSLGQRSELKYGLSTSLLSIQPCLDVFGSLQGDVIFHLTLKTLCTQITRQRCAYLPDPAPQGFHSRSSVLTWKKRSMMPTVCNQPFVSACKALCPARVSR